MDFDSKHGLAFLLSLSAIPMAGCPADDPATTNGDDSSGGSSGTNSSTNSTSNSTTISTGADSSDTSMTVSTTEPATSSGSSGSSDGTGSDSGSDSSSDDDGSSSATTGAAGLCEEFAAHYVECVPKPAYDEAYQVAYCEQQLMYYADYSPECGSAADEVFACLGTVDCGFFDGGAGCETELAAQDEACGGKSSSTSVGSSDAGEDGPVEDGG